ncbi:hypothetical protein DVA67_004105 [Solirubrobacter sp. CPCC 204708]|uniref:Uncharacterized protein n=1 Tax=Solirubrobacter deserti TaxID=2282478 RepID=A0ABT4RUY6_9ACTN|nr:hypothetical protein [Solirubrobacter deserti]MBE2315143.1 hypothetical protein [Solirubrobacter deserti]MDA0142394.1 hypothetical protein [Solirubrobacter deserti]
MEPLVQLSAPGGYVVALLRDEVGLWIGSRRGSAERFGATLIEERRAVAIAGPGWTAVGGPLPARADRAVVRGPAGSVDAELGRGAFIAVLPANEAGPAVRFEDEDGLLLRDPPRGNAITDATDRCPACTALDWELGDDDCVRCRACGHTFRLPTFYAGGGQPAEPGSHRFTRAYAADAVRRAPGPVYAAPGGTPAIRGFGGSDDAVTHVKLATGEIEVDTRFGAHEPPEDAARAAVAQRTTDVAWPAPRSPRSRSGSTPAAANVRRRARTPGPPPSRSASTGAHGSSPCSRSAIRGQRPATASS